MQQCQANIRGGKGRRCRNKSETNGLCRFHYQRSLNAKHLMKNPPVEVSRKTYRSYLASPRWKETRARFFKSGLWKTKQQERCYCCFQESYTYHLHHKSYKRTGNEDLKDLIAVCPECHELIEFVVKFKKVNSSKRRWSFPKRLRKRIIKKGKERAFAHYRRVYQHKENGGIL